MSFPLDKIEDIKRAPDAFRLLTDLGWLESPTLNPVIKGNFLIIDLETTGLNHKDDEVIELGFVAGTYCKKSMSITSFGVPESHFNEPKKAISPFISSLTGITEEMVSGKSIAPNLMSFVTKVNPLVIAHNASFDRPFMEKLDPEFGKLPWACTMTDIDWSDQGFESRKLKHLCLENGFFYDAHRAGVDCLAVAHLLSANQPAFAELLNNARSDSYLVSAIGAPFNLKDDFKNAGYYFSSNPSKCWRKNAKNLQAEIDFLDSLFGYNSSKASYLKMNAYNRFKAVS